MADVHSKKTRSFNMSRIRNKDTSPEILVRKFLFSKGFRYRLNVKELPGKPDLVLKMYNTVIFVNGCFWHGHKDCKYFVIPKSRTEWWKAKIAATKQRDSKNYIQLIQMGWNVIVIWECQLKKSKEKRLQELVEELKRKI